ncbi:hypothetical protein [Bacillus sp. CHD6a]|uniref:hypothetical protein n=1 Tax=Bacillus sp. CHD6a TaxID=1643452 RepID=UPI0006CDE418|nr:hypothetical protein [Bacillus sp. CHD6a]KPB06330.1 hypothetical protein AAV98_00550 [Bacillus sp. CHD6a]
MKTYTKEIIKNVNKIDSEKEAIILLKGVEVFWNLDKIIDDNVNHFTKNIDTYTYSIKKKHQITEVKELLMEFGNKISDNYLNTGLGEYFSKELLIYLGFDYDDIVSDIISDYAMSDEKDMTLLKNQLIDWAIEIDGYKD